MPSLHVTPMFSLPPTVKDIHLAHKHMLTQKKKLPSACTELVGASDCYRVALSFFNGPSVSPCFLLGAPGCVQTCMPSLNAKLSACSLWGLSGDTESVNNKGGRTK